MGAGVGDFFGRLFHGSSKPPADPQPDPVVTPDPVTPPDTVSTIGLPGQRMPVVIWLERRSCKDADEMIGKYGLSKIRDLLIVGGSGISVYGRSLRVLHGNSEPRPASFSQWYSMNTGGCAGWALDWEDWAAWPENRAYVRDSIRQTAGKCWLAPQLWLGGGNPFHPIFGQDHALTVADCAGADLMPWQYGSTAEKWESECKRIRAEGFTGVIVPITDGGRREGDPGGYNTVAEAVRIVKWCRAQNLGTGLFMPQLNPAKIKPVLDAIVAAYGVSSAPIDIPDPVTPPAQPAGATPTVKGSRIVSGNTVLRPILDTAWQIVENCDDVNAYLDRRKAQGFNGIILGSDGSWFSGDTTKPVEVRFQKAEQILDALEARGMWAVMVAQLQQYDAAGRCVIALNPGLAGNLGKYMADRFKAKPAVLAWLVGGLDEVAQGVPVAVPDAIAKAIRSSDPVRPIMYHPKAREVSTDRLPLSDYCDVVSYQAYHESSYTAIMEEYNRSVRTGVPWCMIEGPYEGDTGVTPENVIRAQTTVAKVNPCLMAFGNLTVALFKSGWKSALDLPAAAGFINATKQYYR